MDGILDSAPDECVNTLAAEGKSFLEARRLADQLLKSATDSNVEAIGIARRILDEQWPLLVAQGAADDLAGPHKELVTLLESDECLQRIEAVKLAAEEIAFEYRRIYTAAFEKRREVYRTALETIKGREEWMAVQSSPIIPSELKDAVFAPLRQRAEAELDLPAGATVCRRSGVTLGQIESDTMAVEAVAGQVLRRLMELAAPEEKIDRVSVARLYPARIASQAELDDFLKRLRERLEKILAAGSTIVLE